MVPREAVLHITSCCTHHCPFCYYVDDSGPSFSQKYNILESIIDELAKYGCESILFVGGDPASHPDVTRILGVNMTRLVPSLRDPHIFLHAY